MLIQFMRKFAKCETGIVFCTRAVKSQDFINNTLKQQTCSWSYVVGVVCYERTSVVRQITWGEQCEISTTTMLKWRDALAGGVLCRLNGWMQVAEKTERPSIQ